MDKQTSIILLNEELTWLETQLDQDKADVIKLKMFFLLLTDGNPTVNTTKAEELISYIRNYTRIDSLIRR